MCILIVVLKIKHQNECSIFFFLGGGGGGGGGGGSSAMVMSGQSAHLATLFTWASLIKQLTSTSCTYFSL